MTFVSLPLCFSPSWIRRTIQSLSMSAKVSLGCQETGYKIIIRWLMMFVCFYFAADDKIKGCMEHTWGCHRLRLLQFCHQTYWHNKTIIFLWNNSVTWKRSGQQRSRSIFWACKFMIIKYLLYRASGTRERWGWGGRGWAGGGAWAGGEGGEGRKLR